MRHRRFLGCFRDRGMMGLGSGMFVLSGENKIGEVRDGRFGSDGGLVGLLLFQFLFLSRDEASASLLRL